MTYFGSLDLRLLDPRHNVFPTPEEFDFAESANGKNYFDILPNEILEMIVYETIDIPGLFAHFVSVRGFARIARVCKRLYAVANPILYRWNIQHGDCSGLFWAVRQNRVDVFKRFVQSGASVNINVTDQNPAMVAVIFGSTDIVRYMLTLPDVDWNRKSANNGTAPLHMAMVSPTEITQLLLNCKDVSIDEMTTGAGNTALHYASEKNMLPEAKIILERGADPDVRNGRGWSPLNHAVGRGYTDMVRLLLETGKVDINVNPEDGQPPLAAAAVKGFEDIFDILISHPDIDIEVVLSCDYTKEHMEEIPSDLFNRLVMQVAEVVEGDEE